MLRQHDSVHVLSMLWCVIDSSLLMVRFATLRVFDEIVGMHATGKRDTLPASHPLGVACDDMSIDAANDERLFVRCLC